MKKVLFISALSLAFVACTNSAESTEATQVDSTSVVVDSSAVNAVVIDTMEVVD